MNVMPFPERSYKEQVAFSKIEVASTKIDKATNMLICGRTNLDLYKKIINYEHGELIKYANELKKLGVY